MRSVVRSMLGAAALFQMTLLSSCILRMSTAPVVFPAPKGGQPIYIPPNTR